MRDKILFGLTILWIIAFSVVITILLAFPLFHLEISWYHLDSLAKMNSHTLMHNFAILMNYLLNPFVSHLAMPNFPSSVNGLKHFSEVKQLFLLAIALSVVLIPAFIIFMREHLSIRFHSALRLLMAVPIFMGIVVYLLGFNDFFIYFHEAIFRDNTWLFNPNTDPIINVLPEQYFMHTFIIFLIIYEFSFFLLYRYGYSRTKKRKI
ncbi:TIGR01906 family membrane protein [Lactococcus nasutitermitis]|uniref:TIGR01906 family membrane protein n=1 Tax=Lactococcus nasutitermitis TaxID=1652957 RepID=A0ABV9JCY5_9LACT|nr:TIGR01906 family membrane protein [Lactococcus nasutitermitis]